MYILYDIHNHVQCISYLTKGNSSSFDLIFYLRFQILKKMQIMREKKSTLRSTLPQKICKKLWQYTYLYSCWSIICGLLTDKNGLLIIQIPRKKQFQLILYLAFFVHQLKKFVIYHLTSYIYYFISII